MPSNTPKREPAEERRNKRKAERKAKQMSCRILVVCEGEKTEPNYFKAFKTINNESFVYTVDAVGFGTNTIDVVKTAIKLQDEALVPFDAVWAVFDKDSFPADRFNAAIQLGQDKGIYVAWSNEAFELWYLLHFHYRNTPMSRDEYKKAISDAVNKSGQWKDKKPYVYAKNDKSNYAIMTQYGSLDNAIANSKKLNENFTNRRDFHTHNPCTTVHNLILQLLNKDQNLIKEVMDKIEDNYK